MAICGLITLAGCATSDRAPATSQPASQAALPESNAELVDYISDQPFVTAEPACRAIYTLWKGESFAGSYDELVASLKAGKIVSELWDRPADGHLDRAAVGFMICRACGISSGVNWWLTGLGRYAWRELTYKGIARGGSEWRRVSGGEFLGLLVRADEYLVRQRRGNATSIDLGDSPSPTMPDRN
ncbi:MAG: hypothetical protein ACKVS9_19690 [Phycisphaerae bacterium]